jgi:hypothetical protein
MGMNEIFFHIEDIADFSEEASDKPDLSGNTGDALLLLNSQPLDEFWHRMHYVSSYATIFVVTIFDLDISNRWLTEWEIPFDHIIDENIYHQMPESLEND